MIDLSTPNEWQHIDPLNGLVMPWYTKPALDEIVTWDLKDKKVFEYGGGASTLWWSAKAKQVRAIETSPDWRQAVSDKAGSNTWVKWTWNLNDFEDAIMEWETLFDIIVVDCDPVEWRDRCIRVGIKTLNTGGKLIADNWDQPSVWTPSDKTRETLKEFDCKLYKQPNHPDWQTAIFTKS
jgi:hypothetical protein